MGGDVDIITKKLFFTACVNIAMEGIFAAHAIGEPGTQITLRTFHTGGGSLFSIIGSESPQRPFNGKVLYPFVVPGCISRSNSGQIGFLVREFSYISFNSSQNFKFS